ncbi:MULTISPECIES: ParA family protein [Pedobacter]|uniref:Chromosome partitioning protein n=1 Tax=Pedobacter suwonensis TaxID=332999 RepID=A0A1I0TT78_9SPHI|nr:MULTISPECIES: ParA family protein [Pedobacter]SFA55005.1 chromosome partitioning protein [Pedobacter suwonensis]
MLIIIGNQKGGAGKSTLTLLLANFLTLVKKRKVTVIDMDYQQSLAQKYEKTKAAENPENYEIIAAGLEHFPSMYTVLSKSREHIVIIDLPGKLDDDGLIPVFSAADLILCPFAYDEFSFDSTVLFSVVLKKINPSGQLVFIPNRIKGNVRYDTASDVETQLSKFGKITPVISDRVDFQRTDTFQTPLSLYPVILPVFDQIYSDHIEETASKI